MQHPVSERLENVCFRFRKLIQGRNQVLNFIFQDLIRHISLAEIFVTRAQLLLVKLQQEKKDLDIKTSDLEQFVSDLLEHPEVNIDGGSRSSLGTIIHRLFTTSCKVYTEIILYCILTCMKCFVTIAKVF